MASASDSEVTNGVTSDPQPVTEPAIKPDTAAEEPSILEKKIIRQMEFYFGDRNLTRDQFLQGKIKEDSDGWVTLEVLLTFNRLKTLSTDSSVIAMAIRKSTSGMLEVSSDGGSVRRVNTTSDTLPSVKLLSPEVRKEMRERTLHLKGFPEDTTLDDIQEWVLQFGETVLIQMRRYTPEHEDKPRKFKGSAFVEFKDPASVEKVTQTTDLKYKDNELQAEPKDVYLKRQNLKRKSKSSVDQEPEAKVTKTEAVEEDPNIVRKKEAVLHFTGCGGDTNREQIKELMNQWSEVAWVDFNIGDTEGHVRFDEDGGATKAYDAMTKDNVQICGADTVLKVLEGDQELQFWQKMKEDQFKRRRQNSNRRGRGGGRGGRGNRRGGFKKRGRHAPNED